MKKSYAFNILGSTRCIDCGTRLKKRFEDAKKPRRCFADHVKNENARGHTMKG